MKRDGSFGDILRRMNDSAGYTLGYLLFAIPFGLLGLWFVTWFVTRIAYGTVKTVQEKAARRGAAEPSASARLHQP